MDNAIARIHLAPHSTVDLEHQLAVLAQAASALAREVRAEQLREHALKAAVKGTHAQRGVILLHDRSAGVFWGTPPAAGWSDEEAMGLSIAAGDCAAVDAVFSGRIPTYECTNANGMPMPAFLASSGARTVLIVPVWSGKDIVGVTCLVDKNPAFGPFSDGDAVFAKTVLMQLSTALRSARLRDYGKRRGAEKVSVLFSRGDFDHIVVSEIERAQQLGLALGCAVLEIANVAQTLRLHGPAALDAALKVIAEEIRRSMRQTDLLIRYDESTVALVMPGTDASGSHVVAARLSDRLRAIDVPKVGRLEVHCGVASFPDEARDAGQLVATAVMRARE